MNSLMKFALSIVLCGMFAACDDSGSSASEENIVGSSSSDVVLSSSQNQLSSSSDIDSSSQVMLPSSSSNGAPSSSSLETIVSSSQNQESSSSVETCGSASSKVAWDYLNPNVSYGEMTDKRDCQVYKTVTIGEQTWMAENMNYAYNEPTSVEDSSSFCYNNSADSCSKYGRLYLWSAAMDSAALFSDNGKGCGYGAACGVKGVIQGVCPEGWHLPDSTEWSTLLISLASDTANNAYMGADSKLESASTWINGHGTNDVGFSALSAGHYDDYVNFNEIGEKTGFWSSTAYEDVYAYAVLLYNFVDYAFISHSKTDKAYPVRCIKD